MTYSPLILRRIRNVSEEIGRGNQNMHFMLNRLFFRTSQRLSDNVEKYSTARQATGDNTIWSRKDALRMKYN